MASAAGTGFLIPSPCFFGTYDAELGFNTGGLTYNHLSMLFFLAGLAFTLYIMWRGRQEHSLWLGCFVFMQCIFMLTTRMHERYQMVVLPFALVIYAVSRKGEWLGIFAGLSVITFVNQFMLLIRNNTIGTPNAPWDGIFNPVQSVMSAVNLAVFAFSLYQAWSFAFPSKKTANSCEEVITP